MSVTRKVLWDFLVLDESFSLASCCACSDRLTTTHTHGKGKQSHYCSMSALTLILPILPKSSQPTDLINRCRITPPDLLTVSYKIVRGDTQIQLVRTSLCLCSVLPSHQTRLNQPKQLARKKKKPVSQAAGQQRNQKPATQPGYYPLLPNSPQPTFLQTQANSQPKCQSTKQPAKEQTKNLPHSPLRPSIYQSAIIN